MNDDLNEQIDAQLRAAFAPPPQRRLAAIAAAATPAVAAPTGRALPWLLAAAVGMLAAVLAFDAFDRVRSPGAYRPAELGAVFAAAYDRGVASGWDAGRCCEVPVDLGARCQEQCGQGLSFAGREGVELRGCYCGVPTGGCVGLMLRAEGTPVSAFVLRADEDPGVSLEGRDDVALARRQVGDLVVYSLGAAGHAAVLASFSR